MSSKGITVNVDSMKVAELRIELRKRGLPYTGLKMELQKRLKEAIAKNLFGQTKETQEEEKEAVIEDAKQDGNEENEESSSKEKDGSIELLGNSFENFDIDRRSSVKNLLDQPLEESFIGLVSSPNPDSSLKAQLSTANQMIVELRYELQMKTEMMEQLRDRLQKEFAAELAKEKAQFQKQLQEKQFQIEELEFKLQSLREEETSASKNASDPNYISVPLTRRTSTAVAPSNIVGSPFKQPKKMESSRRSTLNVAPKSSKELHSSSPANDRRTSVLGLPNNKPDGTTKPTPGNDQDGERSKAVGGCKIKALAIKELENRNPNSSDQDIASRRKSLISGTKIPIRRTSTLKDSMNSLLQVREELAKN
jgi:hypothetical protein